MAYDLRKWTERKPPTFPRSTLMRWLYTIPLVLAPLALILRLTDGFGIAGTSLLQSLFWLGACVGAVLSWGSPFARDTWSWGRRTTVFDERERQVLADSGTIAFQLVTAALLLAAAYAWLAASWDWSFPQPDRVEIWFMLVVLMAMPLPVILAEWRTPLPPEDEEDDIR